MASVFIEIPRGEDIVEGIIRYAQHHQVSVTVLHDSGPISSVTLKPTSGAPSFPMEGRFQMTSLFGIYINANCDDVPAHLIVDPPHSSFSICFANNEGKVFAGVVGGRVIAADVIYVNAMINEDFDFVDASLTHSDSENDSN